MLEYPAIFRLLGNRLKPKIDEHFAERLMLAVTEVNGCELCSYAHAKMALQKGMSQEEIDSFLQASGQHVCPEEAPAILFAQHYADSKGKPDRIAYQTLLDTYARTKAEIILSAIQVMMIGNIAGIPLSALVMNYELLIFCKYANILRRGRAMAKEKRKAPRFSLHQLIRMSVNREEFLQAEGVNISLTGVLLHTDVAIDLYTTLFLMFEVETEEETYMFKTEGIVMRSEKENDYYSIGLQFTELTEEEKEHLKQYLEGNDSP